MLLTFEGKQKATLEDVDVQTQKMGQTDMKPAVCLHWKASTPNSCLRMYGDRALEFLYKKDGPEGAKQKTLDGVSVVSEYSQLTDEAIALGAFNWDGDQTGSTLFIYHGIGEKPKFTLRDGTVNKRKTTHHEGGTVDNNFRFFTTDVDAETLGELAVLKSHELFIELVGPTVADSAQRDLDDGADKTPSGPVLSPEEAFKKSLAAEKVDPAADEKVTTAKVTRMPKGPAAKTGKKR
ncbi:MAG: hypothetical protein V4718_04225 [Pseudomonadota bacterium]